MKLGSKLAFGASILVLGAAGTAAAQDDDTLRQSTVTVTGSAIAGTPEDAALPVDVLTAGDLKIEGSPSITELIRNLGVSSGVDGQTNQFASNGLEGTSNVNLRGLGPARTLVLINGRRQTVHPYAIGEQAQLFVDTNMIPSAAVGRIEVLKDGAAAIYGSDAIAGVVNFITRDDLSGFEIGGDYSTFDGTDGDYNINAAYGLQGDNWSWVTSVGYNFRNEVPLLEKDWAILPYEDNPVGGWSSLSNPGYYVPLGVVNGAIGAISGPVLDSGCTDVGGTVVGTCRFQFTQFDNLVEEEERYQVFSEYNRTFANGVDFHLEGLYGFSDVPSWKTSPSYPPQVLTNQVVPGSHPGLQQYMADNPGAFPAGTLAALYIGRSFGWGGFPGTNNGPQEGFRTYESYRLAGDLTGQWSNGVTWDTALSWSTTEGERITNDTYINGLTIALQGFGLCGDANTGAVPAGAVPGQGGCEYYNPFSNAIQAGAINGNANPQYNPALANSAALADWMTDGVGTVVTTDLLVWDASVSGISNVQTSGGSVGWAAGVQVRREGYEVDPNEVTDLTVNPGPGGTGPFSFLAGTTPADRDQTIYAVFGELQVPLFEDVDMQFAVRYEDYGGEVGSTFDPKVAGKWQVNDQLALRGSAQTSFRGPTLNQLDGVATTLQFVSAASAFKAVDQFGNPELSPESAFSFNIGGLYDNLNGFTASIDYYNFDFSDPIIVEDQADIVGAAVAAINAGDTENPIISRITFTDNNDDGINQANEIARIRTNIVNGPDIKTSGIDLRAEQVWDMGASEFSIGGEATYIIEYDVDDFEIEGVLIAGGDRVGQFNRSNFSRSLPQWKGNFFANWAMGNHNVRGVMRHVDSYDDERAAAARGGVGAEIDSQTTFDAFYTYRADAFDLGLSVVNITDEDPPFAAFDLNYDPYTHNPFGRTFKVSVTTRFGG
ncbi:MULTISPECIES: TonB-dependent receptor plug domain-containing protein [Henriciella]|jgi:iron complex outermembrane recepter protein|uniref:TonB-dependent receptor n=1 Tax=Henriciella pelagia TaxID=1977912 RepID=A0ABQ1JTJ1_9PROT|nr:TonB-dependent receptor [Henriciella pelagia]GGB75248.1 TonB-dependent receptor [Henriciella pelagia]